jgi:hypothetical protein
MCWFLYIALTKCKRTYVLHTSCVSVFVIFQKKKKKKKKQELPPSFPRWLIEKKAEEGGLPGRG